MLCLDCPWNTHTEMLITWLGSRFYLVWDTSLGNTSKDHLSLLGHLKITLQRSREPGTDTNI
jgi:hypothetical protein